MPTHSAHPPIVVPPVDLWTFIFERTNRPFPDDHGKTPFRSAFLYLPPLLAHGKLTGYHSRLRRRGSSNAVHIRRSPRIRRTIWPGPSPFLELAKRRCNGHFHPQQCRRWACHLRHRMGRRRYMSLQQPLHSRRASLAAGILRGKSPSNAYGMPPHRPESRTESWAVGESDNIGWRERPQREDPAFLGVEEYGEGSAEGCHRSEGRSGVLGLFEWDYGAAEGSDAYA
jgi:hypothetical protein